MLITEWAHAGDQTTISHYHLIQKYMVVIPGLTSKECIHLDKAGMVESLVSLCTFLVARVLRFAMIDGNTFFAIITMRYYNDPSFIRSILG